MFCLSQSGPEVGSLSFIRTKAQLTVSIGATVFMICFLTLGILTFAILIAFVRSTALEAVKEHYKSRERAALERIKTRHSIIVENHSRPVALLIYLSCGLYHPKHDDESPRNSSTAMPAPKPSRSERRKQKHFAYEEKIEELNLEQRQEFRSQVSRSLSPLSRFKLIRIMLLM